MQTNQQKITGVFHHIHSAECYILRRYVPESENPLALWVDQFWMVDWDLRGKSDHVQQNLPDPSFHLVIDCQQGARLLGPVSKAYIYTMSGRGRVIGVKFHPGVLSCVLPFPLADYVNAELSLPIDNERCFNNTNQELGHLLAHSVVDEQIVACLTQQLQTMLPLLPVAQSPGVVQLQQLIEHIRTDNQLHRTEQLAEAMQMSVRAVQRLFKHYLGLSPKWLIRKYRLHWALEALDQHKVSLTELACTLGYSDQSHHIRDFKMFTGNTPGQYLQHNPCHKSANNDSN